jgi:hypothetical protein
MGKNQDAHRVPARLLLSNGKLLEQTHPKDVPETIILQSDTKKEATWHRSSRANTVNQLDTASATQ